MPSRPPDAGRFSSWYVTLVLMITYCFAFIDRQALSLLVEPIKHDLSLSDTKISFLQGFAFALVIAFATVPIGRLVDTKRRTNLVAMGIAFWSLMTAGCGLVSSYVGLLACRIGVGAGESAMTPSAHSVIGDLFSPRRLGAALGVYSIGAYAGTGLALLLGATVIAGLPANGIVLPGLGSIRSWQAVFLIVGLPGLVVAVWVATLREPSRTGFLHEGADIPLSEVYRYFKANLGSALSLNFCVAFVVMASYVYSAWVPSFFIRTFGWTVPQAGRAFGLIAASCGSLGVVAGGVAGDYLAVRYPGNGRIAGLIFASLAAVPFAFFATVVDRSDLALGLLAPTMFFITMSIIIGPAAQQEMVPNQMRGMMSAMALWIVNFLGFGLGPIAVALITDYVLGDERQLRYAMAAVGTLALLASAGCGVLCLRPYAASRARLRSWAESSARQTRISSS